MIIITMSERAIKGLTKSTYIIIIYAGIMGVNYFMKNLEIVLIIIMPVR